jgi:hypothetical protein
MSGKVQLFSLATLTTVLLAACTSSTAPNSVSLASVAPAPGATGASTTASVAASFTGSMMSGMEQYMDLHQGGVDGPIMPMTCVWNGDRTSVTCTPNNPLAGGTQYTIHMGAGMTDDQGHMINMDNWTTMGGHWATSGMMGGTHGGMAVGSMGSGWKDGMGHYGMLFTFTTAANSVSLASVTPPPGATSVSTTTTVVASFSQPMMAGMEQYVDLHQGGVDGPIMPMSCAWNGDRTTLTCTPNNPLAGGTQYTIHMGAGMMDGLGDMMDVADWTTMGGQWATGGMMGGTHGGMAVGMMGAGWTDGSGHYGMLFPFTTN